MASPRTSANCTDKLLLGGVTGLENVALRYFNIFGPRQDPSSPYSGVLAKFCTAFLEDTPPVVFGDGEQTRDFTFVENAVQANLLACERAERFR